MKTRLSTNRIVILTADDGMILRKEGSYASEVWLGKNDSPDNWKEVDYSEYEEWQAEQDRLIEEEMKRVEESNASENQD